MLTWWWDGPTNLGSWIAAIVVMVLIAIGLKALIHDAGSPHPRARTCNWRKKV